jgi:hypothetical protein
MGTKLSGWSLRRGVYGAPPPVPLSLCCGWTGRQGSPVRRPDAGDGAWRLDAATMRRSVGLCAIAQPGNSRPESAGNLVAPYGSESRMYRAAALPEAYP